MHRTPRFLREDDLSALISALPGTRCYQPIEKPTGTDYGTPSSSPPSLRGKRPTSPTKPFFLPSRERVAAFWGSRDLPEIEPFSLVGLRNCDLLSIRYLDHVFLGGVCEDPFYKAHRAAAFLVSVDCSPPQESCFCTAVGGVPYADGGYDLNLTPVAEGYLVVAGTGAGESVLLATAALLTEAKAELLAEGEELRARMVESLSTAARSTPDPQVVAERLGGSEAHASWEPWAGKCVECGACTAVCPTCHCYYIIDSNDAAPGSYTKIRTWDSCLLAEYARMAGMGAKLTPRPRLRSRLANRVLHKYVYSFAQYGMCGCLGCGRCDEACLGAIAIRDVVNAVGASR
ncbi:MAG: 4Fe-4S dicluster domain-containing protein [Candidatus Eisenbacteria bacterium]|jgi:formate hydrogenlyase subunit 6/NADH:ubiquinone oxidoreductase subunit I|nr:4Fe-4S dicluster domain-containing protein [Candidatus Eisenbacteria bacterium]